MLLTKSRYPRNVHLEGYKIPHVGGLRLDAEAARGLAGTKAFRLAFETGVLDCFAQQDGEFKRVESFQALEELLTKPMPPEPEGEPESVPPEDAS